MATHSKKKAPATRPAVPMIEIRGAREHNLKNIDVDIPIDQLTVITGLSGSGKSSLAFDTLYAEGQRRYVESLSAYARQFLGLMNKPDVDRISGLSPAISIEQKSVSKNPRSTVGTVTEIYDYLRLLFARVGTPHCPDCQREIRSQSAEQIVGSILSLAPQSKVQILAPMIRGRKGTYEKELQQWHREGFGRVRINGDMKELGDWAAIKLDKNKKHDIAVVVDRIVTKSAEDKDFVTRLTNSVETALSLSKGLALLVFDDKNQTEQLYSQHMACIDCSVSYEEIQPRSFSFNSPFGACPDCHGLGMSTEFDPDLLIPDKDLSLMEGAVKIWGKRMDGYIGNIIEALSKQYNFSPYDPIKKLSPAVMKILMYGADRKVAVTMKTSTGSVYQWNHRFEGIIPQQHRHLKQTSSAGRRDDIMKYMRETPCGSCHGQRLKPQVLAVLIGGKNISEVCDFSVLHLKEFFGALELTPVQQAIAKQVLKEVRARLEFLDNVGLSYLTLSRRAGSLSGGEGQRIRLATQIGSELRGVLYILDEPSIGLHQRDNNRLISTLQKLRDLGNTVVVVEHDRDTMEVADHLIDMGPGAGIHGGHIVAAGTPAQVIKNKASLTGQYLAGHRQIVPPTQRRKIFDWLEVQDAFAHNLKHITVRVPLKVFCCVTGVSGSGKSTLVNDVLFNALSNKIHFTRYLAGGHGGMKGHGLVDKVIIIDQSPIGRTPRSNPATYIGVFTDIRDLFTATKDARERGYKPGRFSFNVPGGRCENCEGDGLIKIEMNFLPDVYVQCEQCKGTRYNKETLEVKYKSRSIADVLAMTVEEALLFFEAIPPIRHKLQMLNDVGLGYITLGQSATTLSGGEAQRMKLTAELARRPQGNTLYILDEPTTGLHFEDVKKLMEVLNRLVDRGSSVLVIEHNLDVIKMADWIIDLGPEGGDAGGQIVAEGPPEVVVRKKKSYTAHYLKIELKR